MTEEELHEAKAQLARFQNKPAPSITPKKKLTDDDMGKQTRRGMRQVKPDEYEESPYHADYTETMNSSTLIKIRNSIMETYPARPIDSPQAMRFRRITQVLRSRGMQNLEGGQ